MEPTQPPPPASRRDFLHTASVATVGAAVLPLAPAATAGPAPGASSPDREQVLRIVQAFFDALAAKNADAYGALFLPGAQITAARPTAQGADIRQRPVEDDLRKLPTYQNRLLERMWNPNVLVTHRIAVVWAPYDFHTNGRFSHTGTDIFSLLQTAAGWKIASLVYSVEPDTPSRHPAGPP